jgi:predicted porin
LWPACPRRQCREKLIGASEGRQGRKSARRAGSAGIRPLLGAQPDVSFNGYLVGATIPIGAGMILASNANVKYDVNQVTLHGNPKAEKFSIGYVYNLSKRTALYAIAARANEDNGASLTVGGPAFVSNSTYTPANSTGYAIGLRHAF